METLLHIEGMKCPHCEARVKKALEALPQVAQATVSHVEGTARVTLSSEIDPALLEKAVTALGFSVK